MVSINQRYVIAVDWSSVSTPVDDGRAVKVFYPTFPPDRNRGEGIGRLQGDPRLKGARPS